MSEKKKSRISKHLIQALVVANAIVLLFFSIALIATKASENEFLLSLPLKITLLYMVLFLSVICFCYYIIVIMVKELYSLKILLIIVMEHIYLCFICFVDPFALISFFLG